MNAAVGTIYGLVDPRTGGVRYVGQTVKPLAVRLAGHMAAPAPRVKSWIAELAVEGRVPDIVPIREDVPAEELDEAERAEIRTYAESGDLLNTASNELGNAKRRKASREEVKRRKAEEEAMERTWRQASWRQVADQVRAATGGPISPDGIPIRDIPARVWETYLVYRETNQYPVETSATRLLHPPRWLGEVNGCPSRDEETEQLFRQREGAQAGLEQYLRAYCGAFGDVDEHDRRGPGEGVYGRGGGGFRSQFRDPEHMARYLSLVPWAARAMAPWVDLAEEAGIDVKSQEFTEWVSDDEATRDAVRLYQQEAPGFLGVRRQQWDTTLATYMLAVGAAHIPGFVTPGLLAATLEERLMELARDRQMTGEMCQLLQRINPKAFSMVYGRDELAEADEALALPPGTSARVMQHVYGGDVRDPHDRAARLLQRHAGTFDITALPDYGGWSGIHIPGMRVAAACFYSAGLFSGVGASEGEELLAQVKSTWLPTARGLEHLQSLEERLSGVPA